MVIDFALRITCRIALLSRLTLSQYSRGDIIKCTAENEYGFTETMIELNQLQLVQLSAPELISSEPTTDDGKTVLLKWTPVRNAVSYKVLLYNAAIIVSVIQTRRVSHL